MTIGGARQCHHYQWRRQHHWIAARREGDEEAEQTYDKCVSHNYGARKIIDEDEDYVQCMASFGCDSVSTEAAVREAQARQRAASRNDRRRCLNYCTVGAHKSAATVERSPNF